MIKLNKKRIFLAPVLFLIFFSCQSPDNTVKTDRGKLRVLTTIAPLYSFTKNITGDAAVVENLIPTGAGPHEYSLSPGDAVRASDSEVIIKNGVNLETWLDKLIYSAGETSGKSRGRPVIVDTSEGVDIINNDPHIWLSPKNAIIQVRNIRNALIEADNAHSGTYMTNAELYIKQLEQLDEEIEGAIKTFKRRDFVAFHTAFLYFAREYGLRQVAVVQTVPEAEPSPGHIADVIDIIKNRNIGFIFTERGARHKIVESIASDLDLVIYTLDTLETGEFSAGWYKERMRENLSVFEKALK